MRYPNERLRAGLAAVSAAAALALSPAAALAESSGGVGAPGSAATPAPPAAAPIPSDACSVGSGGVGQTDPSCAPVQTAHLVGQRAIAPTDAPPQVQAVIAAANKIATKPYLWGGGHRRWRALGYDCSGAVSFVLHRGGFLASPLDSSGLMRWGARGSGRWITVYSNRGHAYAVIAGLRWDTAGDAPGTGPRWHPSVLPAVLGRFRVRHPLGF